MKGDRELAMLEDVDDWEPMVTTVRCDRCKHWEDAFAPDAFGDMKCCSKISEAIDDTFSFEEGQKTGYFTPPNFGCALFEAKP